MPLQHLLHCLAGRPQLSPSLVGIVAAFSLLNCGTGEDLCGGPFCVTPPGRQEASKLRAQSGDGQVGAPGRELELPLEVLVTDDDERPIPDVEVGFSIVDGGGTVAKPVIRSNHEGLAQVKWTLGSQPGVQTVQAVASSSSGDALTGSPVTFSAEAIKPPPARILLLQAPPSLAQNGIVFDPQPVIGILDADNEPVPDVAVTVSIAAGAGTLHGTTTVSTDAEGRARYENLSIQGPMGPRILRFGLSEQDLEVVAPPVEVGAGPATHMLANAPLAYQGTVNSPVSPAPSVTVRDDAGNPVPGVAITFDADRDGSVSPASVITNASGVAQVTSWTLGRSAGEYSLTARIESAANGPVVFSATGRAGTAGKLQVLVQPSPTAQNGVPFSRQPVIQVTDELGNPASQGNLAITATLASGPGGTLENASARTNASGRATFSDLTLTGLAGAHTLSFSEPTLTGVTSEPISVAAGPPSRLALVASPPPAARSRMPFATQPSIQLQDASGNPVAQAGVEVRASIAAGDGTLAGQTSVFTDGNGRADYTDLAIVGPPGARTLLFASTSPASEVLSAAITLPSVTGITLLTAPPASVVVGTQLAAPASWTLTDAASQPVPDVPVEVLVSSGGAVEPVTASDPNGVVQLPSWTVSQVAGSQYVELQVPGVGVSRVRVEAVSDAASHMQLVSGDNQSAPVDSRLPEPFVVRVLDQYGNGVTDITVEWRTCDDIGEYNTLTDIGGYASASQETGPTPGAFCAKASTPALADSRIEFTYTVTPGTDPVSPTSSGRLRAKPPGPPRRNQ